MRQFSYKAKVGPGEFRSGIIQAENKTVVIKRLRQEGLYPISVEEISSRPLKKSYKKIHSRDIAAFTRQLANLIHSGFSLAAALATLRGQSRHPSLKELVSDLYEQIEKGAYFSQALARHPEAFSFFYLNMIRIGELSGKMDETLGRLAEFKEKEDELIAQVKSALTYPAFLFTAGAVSIFILVAFFIPRFVSMFSDFDQALPLPTRIIIRVSALLSRFGWLLIVASVPGIVFAKSYYKAEQNRLVVDGFILRLPLFRNIIQKMEIARFSYALGVLLKSGVPMVEALEAVSFSVDNRVFRKKLLSFKENIRKGQSLSKCLSGEKLFPALLVNMVSVGEESGELAEMLNRIAATYESEVNRSVKTMVSLTEPVLILFIGGILVLMVFSILLPIFNIDMFAR